MKSKKRLLPLLILYFLLTAVSSAQNAPVILPTDDPETGPPMRVVWPTDPGIRYELQESPTLEPESWTPVAGFPSEAEALAQQYAFETDAPKQFFRVVELDEQAPDVVALSPGDDAFGVGRFSAVTIELKDKTGIDPDSIALSIGEGAAMGLSDPALTLVDGVLTFDLGGDTALGITANCWSSSWSWLICWATRLPIPGALRWSGRLRSLRTSLSSGHRMRRVRVNN